MKSIAARPSFKITDKLLCGVLLLLNAVMQVCRSFAWQKGDSSASLNPLCLLKHVLNCEQNFSIFIFRSKWSVTDWGQFTVKQGNSLKSCYAKDGTRLEVLNTMCRGFIGHCVCCSPSDERFFRNMEEGLLSSRTWYRGTVETRC